MLYVLIGAVFLNLVQTGLFEPRFTRVLAPTFVLRQSVIGEWWGQYYLDLLHFPSTF